MTPDILHLTSCLAMVATAIHLKHQFPTDGATYRRILPVVIIVGLFGAWNFYRFGMEFFVASYSGAMHELALPSRSRVAWVGTSVIAGLLPLACLLPAVGRRVTFSIWLGSLAALPSIISLVLATWSIFAVRP